jgi:hypothetical protein
MYCSGCGRALEAGQNVCPQCGRPVAVPIPPVPGLQFQLESYAGKVKALGVVWLIYAGLSLLLGLTGLIFVDAFMSGNFGPWAHGPWAHGPWMHGPWMHGPWANGALPPFWFGPALLHLVWLAVVVRVGLALAAGWGLLQHAEWGRIVAIIAAILALLKFPLGTALGIWTLVMLLGYRNSTLYEQL